MRPAAIRSRSSDVDPLTGALTRDALMDVLDGLGEVHAVGRAHPAVIVIGVDGLASVNQRYGHRVGDQVLMAVVTRLRACVGPTDRGDRSGEVARLGGDTFAVAIDHASPLGLAALVQRILAAVRAPLDVGGGTARITASIGTAQWEPIVGTGHELLDAAMEAMHEAKASGGDGAAARRRAPPCRSTQWARASMIRDAIGDGRIGLAVERRWSLESGVLGSLVVRLDGRTIGVGSHELTTTAADHGLLHRLTRSTIGEACRLAAELGDARERVTVMAEVSTVQLEHDDLILAVATELGRRGMSSSDVSVELRPDPGAGSVGETTLRQLRGLGVEVVLAGLGLSTADVGLLRRVGWTTVVVDPSVARVQSRADRATLAAVVALAGASGARVAVDGVDEPAVLRHLVDLHCHEVHGRVLDGRPSAAPVSAASLLQGSPHPLIRQVLDAR